MKIIKLIIVLLGLNMTAFAQKKGIQFREFENWDAVLTASKQENKPIFVDAFTTWCGPCKAMEQDVYPNAEVAEFFNKNFISIKVQFDQTAKDSEHTKKWNTKEVTNMFTKNYKIVGYPTFLFIASNGTLLNKYSGFQKPIDFIKNASFAIDPNARNENPANKYYKAIDSFKKGKQGANNLIKLMNELVNFQVPYFQERNEVIDSLNCTYLTYLHTQPLSSLYTKDVLEILGRIGLKSNDPLFPLFYPNEKKVDKIVKKTGFAQLVVDRAIRSEFFSRIQDAQKFKYKSEFNWDSLHTVVKSKYGVDYANRAIDMAKTTHFFQTHNMMEEVNQNHWRNMVINQVTKYGLNTLLISNYPMIMMSYGSKGIGRNALEVNTGLMANNICWTIFLSSDDSACLNAAVNMMREVTDYLLSRKDEEYIQSVFFRYADTYANLLHKVGNTKKAIEIEKMAIDFGKRSNRIDQKSIEGHEATLKKMETGSPTWSIKK